MRKKKKGDTPVGKRERRERRTKKGKEEIRNRERKGKGREGKEGWKEERNNERKKQKGEARKLRSRVGSRPAALFAKVCHKEWLAFKACSELLVATRLILQAPVPAITFALKQRTRRQNATRLGKTYQNRPEAQNDRVDEICNWSGAGFEQGPGQVLEQLLEQVPGQGPEQVLEQVLEQTTSRGGSHKFRSALKLQALGVLILNGVALDRRFLFCGCCCRVDAGAGAGSGSAFWFCRCCCRVDAGAGAGSGSAFWFCRRCRADAGAGSAFCFAGAGAALVLAQALALDRWALLPCWCGAGVLFGRRWCGAGGGSGSAFRFAGQR